MRKRNKGMKLGAHFSYGQKEWNADLHESVDRFAKIGFEVLEFTPYYYAHGHEEEGKELAAYAADRGVKLAFCCGFPEECDMTSDDPAVRNNGVEYMDRLFRLMEKMDVDYLCGALYTAWPKYRNTVLRPEDKRALLARTAETFQKAAAHAGDYGVRCAIEVLNRFETYLINTGGECREFCEMVGNERVKIHYDTFHMNIEEDSITGALKTAGNMLGGLHIAERNRRLPGTGDFPWDGFFRTLKEIGYDGYMDIESFVITGGDISADVALWRDLSGGADRERLDEMARESLRFIRRKLG